MKNIKKILFFTLIILFSSHSFAGENFYNKAKEKFDQKEFEHSKFLFQRNIVFNPKDAKSYLYLAKIFKSEENEKEHIKNIRTTLLLEPENEEAMYMLINYEIKKSNYSEVKELKESFLTICKSLCDKKGEIEESLKDIEVE
jgi:tetratricopeptide (TPR) repeat protein